jgi:hypothetical protein
VPPLCEAVGPQAAFYEVDTTGSLNILDRMTDDLGTQRAAIERRLSVVLGRPDYGAGRVGLRARELTNLEVGAIDQCLGALYADATRTPLLGDLVRELKALGNRPGLEPRVVEAGADLAAEIASVLLGSRGALLGAPTTIRWDFGAPVTGYSFRNVVSTDKALMPLMYDLGWEALNRYVRTRPASAPPVVVILDELAYMSVTPEFQANVALATKAWRNFRPLCGRRTRTPRPTLAPTDGRRDLSSISPATPSSSCCSGRKATARRSWPLRTATSLLPSTCSRSRPRPKAT